MNNHPRSAYVHVPFCRHRCGYCNFTVVANRDDLIADYLRAIEIELSWLGEPRPVQTLFVGGGTPTHLQPPQLEQLLQCVLHWFPPSADAEISVEANPEDIDPPTLRVLSAAGVNRVSLGVQSFHDGKLKTLERSHSADFVRRSIDLLRPHVHSLALDLIFAAPGESLANWEADLQQACRLEIDHLSTYGLTYETGTRFFARKRKRDLVPVDETTELAMYERALDYLVQQGFEHYEVSNFARAGHRCRHNENYWQCGSFYGVGPGASRFVNGRRESNHRSASYYLKRVLAHESPQDESELVAGEDAARERFVFGLRQLAGVGLPEFHSQTGYDARVLFAEPLAWLFDENLLVQQRDSIRLTRKGLLVSDSIWPHLL